MDQTPEELLDPSQTFILPLRRLRIYTSDACSSTTAHLVQEQPTKQGSQLEGNWRPSQCRCGNWRVRKLRVNSKRLFLALLPARYPLHMLIQLIGPLLKPSKLANQVFHNIQNVLHSNGLSSFYLMAVTLTFACLCLASLHPCRVLIPPAAPIWPPWASF